MAILLLVFTTVILFVENKKNRQELRHIRSIDNAHFQIAERNRDELKEDIYELKGLIKNLYYTVKAKVVNHLELQEKLIIVLQSINYKKNKAKEAEFRAFFEKIIQKTTNVVRKLKDDQKRFDFVAKRNLLSEYENILISEAFSINHASFLDLARVMFSEYTEEKNANPKKDSADIIADKFKIFAEAIYEEYSSVAFCKPSDNNGNNNISENNNINNNGNNNTMLQKVEARDININIKHD
jgi:hypothetical protein